MSLEQDLIRVRQELERLRQAGQTVFITYSNADLTAKPVDPTGDGNNGDVWFTEYDPETVFPNWMSIKRAKTIDVGTWGNPIAIRGANGAAGTDGGFIDHIFRRAATQPDTPTGDGTPLGWSNAPPADDGNPLWLSVGEKTAADVLVGTWGAPVSLGGADGSDGASLVVEYSIDGATSWHSTFAVGDIYMRQKLGDGEWSIAIKIVGEDGTPGFSAQVEYSIDGSTNWHETFNPAADIYMRISTNGGTSWSDAARIVGEQGAAGDPGAQGDPGDPGADGHYLEYIFKRAATAPTKPNQANGTGGASPNDWSGGPPEADGNPLWLCTAWKKADGSFKDGVTEWDAPVQIEGSPGEQGEKGDEGDPAAVPILVGIRFKKVDTDTVGWTAGTISFKGVDYNIDANSGGTTNEYIYWVEEATALSSTGTLSTANDIANGKWLVCHNDGGDPFPAFGSRLINAGLIQADSISAISADLGDITAGTIILYGLEGAKSDPATAKYRLKISEAGIQAQWRTTAGGAWGDTADAGTGRTTWRKIIDIADNKVKLSFDSYDSEEAIPCDTYVPAGWAVIASGGLWDDENKTVATADTYEMFIRSDATAQISPIEQAKFSCFGLSRTDGYERLFWVRPAIWKRAGGATGTRTLEFTGDELLVGHAEFTRTQAWSEVNIKDVGGLSDGDYYELGFEWKIPLGTHTKINGSIKAEKSYIIANTLRKT